MKSDLGSLMQAHNLDAILVTGPAQHNPYMVYLTGGCNLTSADLIIKRGSAPLLFHNPMERDEAARTGLATRNLSDYHPVEVLRQVNGDLLKAAVIRYQRMLGDAGVTSGRVAVCGKIDAGSALAVFNAVQEAMPGLTFIGEVDDGALLQAMATKDQAEVERIRQMGQLTVAVAAQVAEFLSSQRVENDVLVKPDGQPLSVGEVKRQIHRWVAERGAENPEGIIFATGRDAAVPHSTGTAGELLRLGQTIVFDFFPCEAGGGYFYDFTRTWCLGYAPDDIQALYEDVRSVYQQILSELRPDTLCRDYQMHACDLFEARGHPTLKGDPQTERGYVHGLGHGVGLNIHERPWFSMRANADDILAPGTVVTVEPGLYYPDRGMGVRLEDTVWVRPDGKMEILAEYPMDLVLPVTKR